MFSLIIWGGMNPALYTCLSNVDRDKVEGRKFEKKIHLPTTIYRFI